MGGGDENNLQREDHASVKSLSQISPKFACNVSCMLPSFLPDYFYDVNLPLKVHHQWQKWLPVAFLQQLQLTSAKLLIILF
jgi:hypothetical protein